MNSCYYSVTSLVIAVRKFFPKMTYIGKLIAVIGK